MMPAQKPGKSKQDYKTPTDFILATKQLLGITYFDVDFAADDTNTQAASWLDKDDNSLLPKWDWKDFLHEGWGWLNPPYDDIAPWAEKCLRTSQAGGRIAFLVPASVGSNWYRDFIHDQDGVEVLFLNGRLCFIENWDTLLNEDGTRMYPSKPLYPKDTMLVLYYADGRAFDCGIWSWSK
jgi:phage N-6-adenine-methyltransferase